MMKLTRLVGAAVILGSVSAGTLLAQTAPGSQPAEFPPASYSGKQYVDSKGCVFIRAGIDGTVSWIPRVGRDRKGICGFKPTLAGQVTEVETTPIPEEAVETVSITPAPAPRPAPKPRVVRQTAPKKASPKPVEIVLAPVVPQPPLPAGKGGNCSGASALSQRYINDGSVYPVRCGPQSASVMGVRGDAAPRQGSLFGGNRRTKPISVNPNARIVPRHVALNRANTQNVEVPEGFQPVWEDDRLNPYRAEQTLAGHEAMQLIWTSTVPRRLINQASRRDVTASVALVYPYTDVETQLRELGVVTIETRDGQTVKRIVHNRGTTKPVYSSRSAPKAAVAKPVASSQAQPKAQVPGQGYVDVATYTDAAQAQRMAKRVRRMGMPVRIGKFDRGAKTYRMVIAGPFKSQDVTRKAVQHLKTSGFGGAKLR